MSGDKVQKSRLQRWWSQAKDNASGRPQRAHFDSLTRRQQVHLALRMWLAATGGFIIVFWVKGKPEPVLGRSVAVAVGTAAYAALVYWYAIKKSEERKSRQRSES